KREHETPRRVCRADRGADDGRGDLRHEFRLHARAALALWLRNRVGRDGRAGCLYLLSSAQGQVVVAMSVVEVVVASPNERVVFENLMQLYTHDFSEQWYDRPTGEVDEQGRFPAYPLDPYWRQPDHIPLLLRQNSKIIGFALLNRLTHTDRPLDRNMAEFFVLRKHRRSGAGTQAAQAIFSRYPGMWEAAIARRN